MEETRTPKTGRDWRIFLTLDLDQIPGASQVHPLTFPYSKNPTGQIPVFCYLNIPGTPSLLDPAPFPALGL